MPNTLRSNTSEGPIELEFHRRSVKESTSAERREETAGSRRQEAIYHSVGSQSAPSLKSVAPPNSKWSLSPPRQYVIPGKKDRESVLKSTWDVILIDMLFVQWMSQPSGVHDVQWNHLPMLPAWQGWIVCYLSDHREKFRYEWNSFVLEK